MEIYEKLWRDAVSAFERGEPQMDAHLCDRANDLRRGVTLLFRPSPSVCEAVKNYLDSLAQVCPGQHFYRPDELHVTVLSIISGTEHWRQEIKQLDAYRAIVRDVLGRQHSFKISFQGVTATPGSVMIQGFPVGDGLARIRDGLREAFVRAGFGRVLDRRYKITTAHMTALRFCRTDADWKRLITVLEEGRQTDFGVMEVDRLQLVWGDWYASADGVQVLEEYGLSA